MNFLLSDEQQQLFDTVYRFAREQGGGNAARNAYDADGKFDRDFWNKLMELGIGGLLIPEASGGSALGLIDAGLVAEALGRAAAPAPLFGHWLAGLAIALGGDSEQQARWLPDLASGARIGAIALDGVDPTDWPPAADDGSLTTTIANVPGGDVADIFVIGLAGGGFGVVERSAAVVATRLDGADRTRPVADLVLTGATVTQLSGTVSGRVIDAACTLIAADAYGGAARCVEMAVDYAKVREQFGRPIGAFQGVKFQLADMAVDVEPSRGLYWYAAYAYDRDLAEASQVAAASKAHCTDVFMRAARGNVEAHGGIGYTWEHEAQIYFKRAMFDFAWLGTPADHRSRQARLAGW